MRGFRTANSVYYVDEENQTISGGMFKDEKVNYDDLVVMVGFKAQIKLTDGSYKETTKVNSLL